MNVSTKTMIRHKLELIEEEIQASWLKDQDRTQQMLELCEIFTEMVKKDSLEEYFDNNQSDLEYFLNKFSKETTSNLLRQTFVYGESGDDIALITLLGYVKLWLKFADKLQYAMLWDTVRDIFDPLKPYFRVVQYFNMKVLNSKKLVNSDQFNNSLPKNPEKYKEYVVGDEVDILIDNQAYRSIYDMKAWIRGTVSQVDDDFYHVLVAEEGNEYRVRKGLLGIAKAGTMTKDYEWRTSLQKWDVIDSYDRGKWYPATIVSAKHDTINGHIRAKYKVGFRLYVDKFPDWKNYCRYWDCREREVQTDIDGERYIGDHEGLDESINHYSKRIQKFKAMITKDYLTCYSLATDDLEMSSSVDDFYLYEHNGKKYHIIGRGSQFSCYFALFLSEFAAIGGFEKMIKMLSEKPNPEAIYTIFHILNCSISYLHKGFINEQVDNIIKFASSYIKDLNQNDLRNLKKDTMDLIIKVLTLYNNERSVPNSTLVDEFIITTSFRLLKTSIFDKRLQAVKSLVDYIRMNKYDKPKTQQMLKLIEENNVVMEIFGPNTHSQLITKGKELLEFMLTEDRISDKEMELIWAGTQKGDLEGKLTILKMLKDVSKDLQMKHVKMLLQNIYANVTDELIPEEIDLVYELSVANHNDEDIDKCITFFTKCLLNSKALEGNKINSLINKIFDITKIHIKYKSNVLTMCLDSLENDTNTILSLNILTKFLTDPNLTTSMNRYSYDDMPGTVDTNTATTEKSLFKDNFLINLFTGNCRKYKEKAIEYIRTNNLSKEINLGEMIRFDNFSYKQHIKARMDFIQMLQGLSNFIFDQSSFDFIGFAYELLIDNSVTDGDKQEFFKYIEKTLERSSDQSLESQVYKMFEEKICSDAKSCRELSIQAFDSFLKIFLNLNERSNLLQWSPSAAGKDRNPIVKVYTTPEKLTGFGILWKIIFESYSPDIMNKGTDILHALYINATIPSSSIQLEEPEITTEKKKPDESNYNEILLSKCIDMIKEVSASSTLNIEEKRTKIKKCLMILTLIIEDSEKKGTGRIKSHSGLLKRKVLNIRVSSLIGRHNDFTVRVYGNTTMFELKEIICKKAELGMDFLRILVKCEELSPNDNGKTVLEMNIADNEEISITMNSMNAYLPQAEFFINGKVNPDLEKIFNNWFTSYSTDEKMTKETLAQFISAVTSHKENISMDDSRIIFLFGEYDKENRGYLQRADFVSFYVECAKGNKKRIVWDNLHSMGIRNDLKGYNEPMEVITVDKTQMPRYQLSHNEEYFNILFTLQDLHESIAKEAYQFICTITTNPKIFKELLTDSTLFQNANESENIYKLIYSLQIIESFIEDIEIESENIDSFIAEETILGSEGETLESMRQRKIDWVTGFINDGSFKRMIDILNKQLAKAEESGVMDKICLELLIKIIRIFFNSSLNKFEFYRSVDQLLKKKKFSVEPSVNVPEESNESGIKMMNTYTDDAEWGAMKNKKPQENLNLSLKKAISFQLDTNILNELFQGDLGDKILSNIDYTSLASNLMNILIYLCTSNLELIREDYNIIENSFEFLMGVITFSPDNQLISQIVLNEKNFKQIFRFGIIHTNQSIRDKFGNSLIKYSKICEYLKKYDMLIFLFSNCLEIFSCLASITDLNSPLLKNSGAYFDFFSLLFEIFCSYNTSTSFSNELVSKNINPQEFIMNLSQVLGNDLNANEEEKHNIPNELFIGYLKLILKAVENSLEIKQEINEKYQLIQLILTRILFNQNLKEMNEKLKKMDYINPDKFDDKSSRNSNTEVKEICYSFILAMLKNSFENFETFFSLNLLEGDKDKDSDKDKKNKAIEMDDMTSYGAPAAHPGGSNMSKTPAMRYHTYYQSSFGRREDHVGLRNLGCICYMNSMMQQIFMVPTFRYAILQADDKKEPCISQTENVDDNVLHQLQRMYTFLELSAREDYNPHGFCHSFKDFDGRPTNTSIQQDSQEFLNNFFDKIENCLKPTCLKYIINSVFAGRFCSLVICNACGKVSNRFEDFYNLSLEVQNMKTLSESLEKFIDPEKIDEFMCETCQKKVTITKRTTLAELPNVLIIHLKRFFMNYEIEKTEKINTKLEFPKNLNLKKYCIEELMSTNRGDSRYETDEVYYKKDEYYDYHLVGVNVHTGFAEGGHYFSFINTIRKGKENCLAFDPSNESHLNSWLKFNDSSVSKFDIAKLNDECFGGSASNDDTSAASTTMNSWSYRAMDNTQSAYLLIYERRAKTPIKIVVNEPDKNMNETVISFKAEETAKIKKMYDDSRLTMTETERISENEKLYSTYFYDSAKNEYFQFKPFFGLERLIPKSYYLEVNEDNSFFQKQRNIQDIKFNKFFETAIQLLEETISSRNNITPEMSVSFCKALLPFLFKNLNKQDKTRLLTPTMERFISLIELNPNCLEIVFEYICGNPRITVVDTIINDDAQITSAYSKFFMTLIKLGLASSNQDIIRMTYLLIDNLYKIFPQVDKKYLNSIYPVFDIFKYLVTTNELFVEYFYAHKAFCVFTTFLLGKDSPCYYEFSFKEHWDSLRFMAMTNFDSLFEFLHILFKRSIQYNNCSDIPKNQKIYQQLKQYSLTNTDIMCFQSSNFLKLIYQFNDVIFSDLMILLQKDDPDFTLKACEEISKSIEEIFYYDENLLLKLTSAILRIVNINDKYQLMRLQLLVGYPRFIIDDPSYRSNWPLFGYNKLSDTKTKWLGYYGANHAKPNSCILGKISSLKLKKKHVLDLLLLLIEACMDNKGLLKYLWYMPGEELRYRRFIDWGIEAAKEFSTLYTIRDYEEKLNLLIPVLQENFDACVDDVAILKNFKGFVKNYLPKKIKREEVLHVCAKDGMHLFRIEYFTNVISTDQDIDFKESTSSIESFDLNSNQMVDESQNLVTNEDEYFVMDIKDRGTSDREFLKKILTKFENYKKVIVQDPKYVDSPVSILIRYVVLNTTCVDGIANMRIERPFLENDINEFIPFALSDNVNCLGSKTLLTINKLDPTRNWSSDVDGLKINVGIAWINNAYRQGKYLLFKFPM